MAKLSNTMIATMANKTAKNILDAKKKLCQLNIAELHRLERIVAFEETNFKEATGYDINDIVEFVDTENTYETERKNKDGQKISVTRQSVELQWRADSPIQRNTKSAPAASENPDSPAMQD